MQVKTSKYTGLYSRYFIIFDLMNSEQQRPDDHNPFPTYSYCLFIVKTIIVKKNISSCEVAEYLLTDISTPFSMFIEKLEIKQTYIRSINLCSG